MVEINDVKELKFWCHKILPLVYDDSLSYYEVLCKVVAKLNEMVEIINGLDEQINAAIIEYVNEYMETWEVPLATANKNGGLRAEERSSEFTSEVKIDSTTGKLYVVPYTLPIANGNTLGGVIGESKTEEDVVPVHIDSDGRMYVPNMESDPYELPIADSNTLGGVIGDAKTADDVVPVHIGSDGRMYVPNMESEPYELPVADNDTLGGVIGDAKTASDVVPVRIDTDGRMYVPDMSGGGSSDVINVADIMDSQSVDFDTAFDTAISNADDGQTILIPSGTYNSVASHTLNKRVVVKGDGISETVVNINDGTFDTKGWLLYDENIDIEELNIADNRSVASLTPIIAPSSSYAFSYNTDHFSVVKNCHVECLNTTPRISNQSIMIELAGTGIYCHNGEFIGGRSFNKLIRFDYATVIKCTECNFDSYAGDTSNTGVDCIEFYGESTLNAQGYNGLYEFISCNIKFTRIGVDCRYVYRSVLKFIRCLFDAYLSNYDDQAITYNVGGLADTRPSALFVEECTFNNASPSLYGSIYVTTGYVEVVKSVFTASVASIYINQNAVQLIAKGNTNFKCDGISPNIETDVSFGLAGSAINTSSNMGSVTGYNQKMLDGMAYISFRFNMGSNTQGTITLNNGWKSRFEGWFPVINSDTHEVIGCAMLNGNSTTINFYLPAAVTSTYGMRCTVVYPTC